MTIDVEKLGTAIKSIRVLRQFTQATLAEHCGMASNTIARIERGEFQCTIAKLNAISEALGVPASFLTIMATETKKNSASAKRLLKSLQDSVRALIAAESEV